MMLLGVPLPLFKIILSEREKTKRKNRVSTRTFRVTKQLVVSQLNMLGKGHITDAISSKSKSSKSADAADVLGKRS